MYVSLRRKFPDDGFYLLRHGISVLYCSFHDRDFRKVSGELGTGKINLEKTVILSTFCIFLEN